jgi:hypothetical protein
VERLGGRLILANPPAVRGSSARGATCGVVGVRWVLPSLLRLLFPAARRRRCV